MHLKREFGAPSDGWDWERAGLAFVIGSRFCVWAAGWGSWQAAVRSARAGANSAGYGEEGMERTTEKELDVIFFSFLLMLLELWITSTVGGCAGVRA